MKHSPVLASLLFQILSFGAVSSAQTAVTVTLSASPNPVVYGRPLTLVAAVSPNTSSPDPANGTVAFYDGAQVLGSAPVLGGVATFTTNQIAAGIRALTAIYGAAADQAAIFRSSRACHNSARQAIPGNCVPSRTGRAGLTGGISSVGASDDPRDVASSPVVSQTVVAVSGQGFPTLTSYGAPNPNFVAVGDLNGDGKLDLVLTTVSQVYVLLGNGDGTFQAAVAYPAGVNLTSVAIGDFNGDGHPDLVVSDYVDQTGVQSNTVNVLLGNGDGSFQTPVTFAVGVAPWEVVVGDFNRDGIPDLAVSGEFAGSAFNNVSVLLGNGDGTFQPAANYSTSTSAAISPFAVVTGDFNRDGIPDLAVLDTGVTILTGNGDGTFTLGAKLVTGNVPGDVAAADLRGTGMLDLVVTNNYDATISIFMGNGDGTFETQQIDNVQSYPSSVLIGDWNGDGVPDLAVANFVDGISSTLSVLIGSGAGAFERAVEYPAGAGAQIVAQGDFNGDGVPDLVVADYGDGAHSDGNAGVLLGASCNFSIAPPSLAFSNAGGNSVLSVSAASPLCGWLVNSSAPWLQLNKASGSGNGSVSAAVPANSADAQLTGSVLIAGLDLVASQTATPQVFVDVPPTAYYYDAVYLLQQRGITSGCSSNDYCPSTLVTRAQMAVFIVRAILGGDNFTFSPAPWFNDVPANAFGFAWIQKLYELGITAGCGGGNYCPSATVTRAQMAIFIIRTRYGASTSLAPAPEPYFDDVPYGSFGYAYIQRMAQDQITSGCGPDLYCPSDAVTRGDMAVFIMRGAFNQLLPPAFPVISAISPSSISSGATATLTVTGQNTDFLTGLTTVIAVPGLTLSNLVVTGPTSLTVDLTAGASAVQPLAIWVVTGCQQAVLPNALTVP